MAEFSTWALESDLRKRRLASDSPMMVPGIGGSKVWKPPSMITREYTEDLLVRGRSGRRRLLRAARPRVCYDAGQSRNLLGRSVMTTALRPLSTGELLDR